MRNTLLLLALLAGTTGWAEHTVMAGGFTVQTSASFQSTPTLAGVFATWLYRHRAIVGGAGFRLANLTKENPIPLEGFLRVGVMGEAGPWCPLLAVEVGVSGISGTKAPPARWPQDFPRVENRLTGLFYGAMHTEAARFQFRRFVFSVLGFDIGTSLTAAGTVLRLNLEIASVGVRW